jgi:rhodanese-related sulfurtransferase
MPEINILMKFATDNVFLIAVAFVSGAMLIWPALRRGAAGPAISVQQATLMINREDALVLDVREAQEFAKEHILHARNLPLSRIEAGAADLQKHKAKPVIVYCENGSRSGKAASLLRKLGFERVFPLAGGLAAWHQAGLPVEK